MNYLRASPTEFRYRYWTHTLLFGLGFWSPWDALIPPQSPLAGHQSTWLALASQAARTTSISFTATTIALLLLGTLCASAAALLRTWGTACLGSFTVTNGRMQANGVVAEGPYRHVRNPLYLGTWLHALALALLMPPTGAIFTVLSITILQARLIAGEEPFLARSLGAAYIAYCNAVPRVLPSIAPRTRTANTEPRWVQAIVAESYMILVAIAFATFGWRYNAFLLTKCVVIALGISLVLRAVLPPVPAASSEKPAPNPSA